MARRKDKPPVPRNAACVWTHHEELSMWATGCNNEFQFMECDGPKANGMKFCCYCGGVLREASR